MNEFEINNEERARVHQLCKDYLSGTWNNISEDQIIINKFDKGFASKIMQCKLPNEDIECNHEKKNKNEYNSVVIKYIQKEFLCQPLNIKIMTLIMSEKKISPKVLGMFNDGIIFEYIDGRLYNFNDDYNDSTVELLGRKLANIHSIRVPIEKDGTQFYLATMFGFFSSDDINIIEMLESYKTGQLRKQFGEYNKKWLSRISLEEEFRWIERVITQVNSPLVFSHNDFNRGNVIIRGNNNNRNNISASDMFIIDFDYSCYNHRGIDIGRYFSSWRMESDFGCAPFPTDQQMSVFIDAYISENVKLKGNSYSQTEINSRESIAQEAKFFTLFAYLIDIFFCVFMVHMGNPVQTFLDHSETRLSGYVQLKEKFLNEYSIPY